jgi:Kdo2-lipid IVA lauroyltransferase/acyltransferase
MRTMRHPTVAARVADTGMIGLVRTLFAIGRAIGPEASSEIGGWWARRIGPFLRQHRIAVANARLAFPDKSADEIESIVRGAWENLGRTGAEYAHLGAIAGDRLEGDVAGRVTIVGLEHVAALQDDNRPGLMFSAHLANWELLAICAARCGLNLTAVFRPPNSPAAARVVHEVRSQTMGGLEAARRGAAFAMQRTLEQGGHLGALIDQHLTRGVVVDFFGRPALANPMLAKLARRFDCPVHGARVIRLPEARFVVEVTPRLALPRDDAGRIDVHGATQAMTRVVEGWVREQPEQWLWQHRRWRADSAARTEDERSPAGSGPANHPNGAARRDRVAEPLPSRERA